MEESGLDTGDLAEIVFGDPGVPVIDECAVSSIVILILAKGILVNDTVIAGIREEARLQLMSGEAVLEVETQTVMKGSRTSHWMASATRTYTK